MYVYDSVAIPKGVEIIAPEARNTPFTYRGQRRVFLQHRPGYEDARSSASGERVRNAAAAQACLWKSNAGGSSREMSRVPSWRTRGRQRTRRDHDIAVVRNRHKLQERVEEMFRRAEEEACRSSEPSEFLARCGVVVQSDLIHKQNEGATRVDNLAGLFRTVARNYIIDVLGATKFSAETKSGQAVFYGGGSSATTWSGRTLRSCWIPVVRPEYHDSVAAVGAAVKAIEEGNTFVLDLNALTDVAEHSRKNRTYAPPLSDSLPRVHDKSAKIWPARSPSGHRGRYRYRWGQHHDQRGAGRDLSTGKLLDKLYIKTHGNPEESLKRVLKLPQSQAQRQRHRQGRRRHRLGSKAV